MFYQVCKCMDYASAKNYLIWLFYLSWFRSDSRQVWVSREYGYHTSRIILGQVISGPRCDRTRPDFFVQSLKCTRALIYFHYSPLITHDQAAPNPSFRPVSETYFDLGHEIQDLNHSSSSKGLKMLYDQVSAAVSSWIVKILGKSLEHKICIFRHL